MSNRLLSPAEIDQWHLEEAIRTFAHIGDFSQFLAARVGSRKWVVARALTPRLRASGYEVAVGEKLMRRLELEFGLPRLRAALDAYKAAL